MNVLIAPDSFKGTLSAAEVSQIVSTCLSANPFFNIKTMPLADGGEGSLELIQNRLNVERVNLTCYNPCGELVEGFYLIQKGIAYIEVANVSGITLVKSDKQLPLRLNSYGTGQLVKHAIKQGCKNIHLFLGGSATVDGGAGIIRALTSGSFAEKNWLLDEYSFNLQHFANLVKDINFKIITDVDNVLLGPNGAARIFGPQKGADSTSVDKLELAMSKVVKELSELVGTNLNTITGLGAAGGMALPIVAFSSKWKIESGSDYFNSLLNFNDAIEWADVVITGEGCIDEQTLMGKGAGSLALMAHNAGKKVIGIAGFVKKHPECFDVIFSSTDHELPLPKIKRQAEQMLRRAVEKLYEYLTH
ncbi:glycerate kinase [Carboxylicivirga marina]|uniref:glycerate kinase n=1 Tax=Carboxylicivirga marina TaxID=2800988 RepID=UPI0025982B5B|nr:glycerate kinase [uncultured Carboxylicivirga sp.]